MRALLAASALLGLVLLAAVAWALRDGTRGGARPTWEPNPSGRAIAAVAPAGDSQDPPTGRRARSPVQALAELAGAPARPAAASAGDAPAVPPEPELPVEYEDGPLLRTFHESGALFFEGAQIQLADGRWVRDGAWLANHENGAPYERGAYRAGVEDGPWEWWYPDGQRMAAGVFADGARQGPWTFWYEHGSTMMTGSYRDGEGHGPWIYWHETGFKAAEGEMLEGELSGWWSVWDETGAPVLERTGLYREGRLVAE